MLGRYQNACLKFVMGFHCVDQRDFTPYEMFHGIFRNKHGRYGATFVYYSFLFHFFPFLIMTRWLKITSQGFLHSFWVESHQLLKKYVGDCHLWKQTWPLGSDFCLLQLSFSLFSFLSYDKIVFRYPLRAFAFILGPKTPALKKKLGVAANLCTKLFPTSQ